MASTVAGIDLPKSPRRSSIINRFGVVTSGSFDTSESINEALQAELNRIGRDAPVAVLPEGPVTVPYLL